MHSHVKMREKGRKWWCGLTSLHKFSRTYNDTHKKDYFHTLIFTAHFGNIGTTFSIFRTLKTSKLSYFHHIYFYTLLESGHGYCCGVRLVKILNHIQFFWLFFFFLDNIEFCQVILIMSVSGWPGHQWTTEPLIPTSSHPSLLQQHPASTHHQHQHQHISTLPLLSTHITININ